MLPEDPVKLRRWAYAIIVIVSAIFGQTFLTSISDAVNAVTVAVTPAR